MVLSRLSAAQSASEALLTESATTPVRERKMPVEALSMPAANAGMRNGRTEVGVGSNSSCCIAFEVWKSRWRVSQAAMLRRNPADRVARDSTFERVRPSMIWINGERRSVSAELRVSQVGPVNRGSVAGTACKSDQDVGVINLGWRTRARTRCQ